MQRRTVTDALVRLGRLVVRMVMPGRRDKAVSAPGRSLTAQSHRDKLAALRARSLAAPPGLA